MADREHSSCSSLFQFPVPFRLKQNTNVISASMSKRGEEPRSTRPTRMASLQSGESRGQKPPCRFADAETLENGIKCLQKLKIELFTITNMFLQGMNIFAI